MKSCWIPGIRWEISPLLSSGSCSWFPLFPNLLNSPGLWPNSYPLPRPSGVQPVLCEGPPLAGIFWEASCHFEKQPHSLIPYDPWQEFGCNSKKPQHPIYQHSDNKWASRQRRLRAQSNRGLAKQEEFSEPCPQQIHCPTMSDTKERLHQGETFFSSDCNQRSSRTSHVVGGWQRLSSPPHLLREQGFELKELTWDDGCLTTRAVLKSHRSRFMMPSAPRQSRKGLSLLVQPRLKERTQARGLWRFSGASQIPVPGGCQRLSGEQTPLLQEVPKRAFARWLVVEWEQLCLGDTCWVSWSTHQNPVTRQPPGPPAIPSASLPPCVNHTVNHQASCSLATGTWLRSVLLRLSTLCVVSKWLFLTWIWGTK